METKAFSHEHRLMQSKAKAPEFKAQKGRVTPVVLKAAGFMIKPWHIGQKILEHQKSKNKEYVAGLRNVQGKDLDDKSTKSVLL